MHRFFIFIFLYLPPFWGCAQEAGGANTTVFIVGVIHKESDLINADSLLSIVEALSPDLILSETDTLSGYYKKDYTLTDPPKWYTRARKLGVGRKLPPEMEVIYRYREQNPQLITRPFDIAIADRRGYVKKKEQREAQFLNALNRAWQNDEFPASAPDIHRQYISLNNYIFDNSQKGYYQLNQRALTDSTRQLMQLERTYFPLLFDSVSRLRTHQEAYLKEAAFWDYRNSVMAENILRFISQHPGKKIVVLTGQLHKYYLIDLLQPRQETASFRLAEYFEWGETKK